MTGRALLVGVGSYADASHASLRAVADVDAVNALLAQRIQTDVLRDPDEGSVRTTLKALPDGGDSGPLVVLWSGHATGSGELRLLTHDSDSRAMAGLSVAELMGHCAASGAGQLLLILDTCFSGQGVSATDVAKRIMRDAPPDTDHVWVGVLASCQPLERARDGVFGDRLVTLLRDGPTSPDQRRRWSTQNRMITGHDLCDAVQKEWGTDVQRPDFQAVGSAWGMLPNPLYVENARPEVVEHLLRAARAGAAGETRSWFTGRDDEVDRVVRWVRSGVAGLRLLTGSAGTGKSAVAGRVVSLSVATERARLLGQGPLPHTDPGEDSVHAHAHARGRTPDQIAKLLDGQLVGRHVLHPDPDGLRNASLLVGALQARAERDAPPPVLVVDGVDESRSRMFEVARELLVRLAAWAVVVVSARDVPDPTSTAHDTLRSVLAPTEVLDLDDDEPRASGTRAIREYVAGRLSDVDQRMDPRVIAGVVARHADGVKEEAFLLARLVVDQLLRMPVPTDVDGWGDTVLPSIQRAFDRDIATTPEPAHRVLPPSVPPELLARRALTALTWGFGAGFPEDEWVTVTTALCADLDVHDLGRDDVSWVLQHLGRYVVQDGENGVAVYRLAHQSLADHLRPAFVPSTGRAFTGDALPVALALLDRYADHLGDRMDADDPPYLWRYAWRHSAAGGPDGVRRLADLAQQHPDLTGDVALASEELSRRLVVDGRLPDALAFAQDTVGYLDDLADQDPSWVPRLARERAHVGDLLGATGRRSEALAVSRDAAGRLVDSHRGTTTDLAEVLDSVRRRFADAGDAEAADVVAEGLAELSSSATDHSHSERVTRALDTVRRGTVDRGTDRPGTDSPGTVRLDTVEHRQEVP